MSLPNNPHPLVEPILRGNRRALARLITHIENHQADCQQALTALYPHTGQAHLIGLTGPPGTGKSSLISQLVRAYRGQDKQVAVLAIDPTSPFSGGAILGDRIRMRELAGDSGVFIRSMANRGEVGGLAQAVHDSVDVLDAAGFEVILIETVGAGQSEVDIATATHTVVVVEAPGLGDDIQAIKAGILEIADILVVNKADRPGAPQTAATLKAMLSLGHHLPKTSLRHGSLFPLEGPSDDRSLRDETKSSLWQVPVLKTIATAGDGIETLSEAIQQHERFMASAGLLADRHRHQTRLLKAFETHLRDLLWQNFLQQLPPDYISNLRSEVANHTLSPYHAAQAALEALGNQHGGSTGQVEHTSSAD